MRLPGTLSSYLLREVVTYAVLGLLAISIVMVTQNLFRFMDELIAAGFPLFDFASVVGSLAAMLATYTVPIAFLFGVLTAIGRMATDSEITAMHACGIGVRQLVVPVLVMGFAFSCTTAYLIFWVEHGAQLELRRTVKLMAARGGLLQAGSFRRVGERVFFVRALDPDNHMRGVLISDRSDPARPFMIFAEHGEMSWDEARQEVLLELRDGDLHVEPLDAAADRYQRISFASFEYAFPAASLFGTRFSRLRPREMSLAELRAVIARAERGESLDDLRRKDPVQYQLQLHRRFALPFAPICFALVAVPLGLRRRRSARSWGALLCAALTFGYYAVLTFGQFLALQRVIAPAVALWAPNATLAALAAVLLQRAPRVRD